jgi:diguanylate cyclase (GGDEF)-like protein
VVLALMLLAVQRGSALTQLERRRLARAAADQLTGLLDRDGLNDVVRATWAAAAREETMWLLVLDLDHFKTVNDDYGHLVGDELLCGVGVVLRSVLRETDTAFRIGGEEFVLLLRSVDEAEAAERVR